MHKFPCDAFLYTFVEWCCTQNATTTTTTMANNKYETLVASPRPVFQLISRI